MVMELNRKDEVSIVKQDIGARAADLRGDAIPVAHDTERFRLLFTNSRPKMPPNYRAPLVAVTSRQMIDERLRASSET
jgi:hypothetical protein